MSTHKQYTQRYMLELRRSRSEIGELRATMCPCQTCARGAAVLASWYLGRAWAQLTAAHDKVRLLRAAPAAESIVAKRAADDAWLMLQRSLEEARVIAGAYRLD